MWKNSYQYNISSTYVTGDIDIDDLKLVTWSWWQNFDLSDIF